MNNNLAFYTMPPPPHNHSLSTLEHSYCSNTRIVQFDILFFFFMKSIISLKKIYTLANRKWFNSITQSGVWVTNPLIPSKIEFPTMFGNPHKR